MKTYLFPVLLLITQFSFAQVNRTNESSNTNSSNKVFALSCSNWLKMTNNFQRVNIGDLDVAGDKITVEANFNVLDNSGSIGITLDLVSKMNGSTLFNYLLRAETAAIHTTDGINNYLFTTSCCLEETNKTYHVALVYDGATLKLYRNGFLMSQVPAHGQLILNDAIASIGNNAVDGTTKGYVNEARIWNVARTQSEIRAYMNTSLPNPTTQPGLLAYYTFDDLLNKQGNPAWNGSLFGGATINATNPDCNFIPDSCNAPTSISNVINTYTPVISLNPCENKITVEDASTFNAGDTVLMIQMKGAVIDSGNTANFGTVTDYKNAGNYEFNYVKSKSGNIIELKNNLTRQYDIPTGKVQLIRVPYYNSATITSTLTCLPWDGAKGGVLVLNVKNDVDLAANIDVSGKGFRGAKITNPKNNTYYCHETQYYYPIDPIKAAPKGEGIAEISLSKSYGRGSLANGGGGGSEHNAGGGGGSNSSIGGNGGKEWITCGPASDNGGIGGRALAYSNISNKIFLGGGGGAGHCDNIPGFNPNGGDGGGIIIIQANSFKANGKLIISEGSGGIECTRDNQAFKCHEGMGGGGGGGTILLAVGSFLDNVNANVKGGKGADMNGELAGKLGPGGGGSGGLVWLSKNTLPGNIIINSTGGINGVNIDFGSDSYGATVGQNGNNLFNLIVPTDVVPFKKNIDSVKITSSNTSCNSYNFNGLGYINTNPVASWQWYFGDGGTANTQNPAHTYSTSGLHTVKLVITDLNGCKDSTTIDVASGTAATMDFSYKQDICNPLSVQFFGDPNNSSPYYDFGDGTNVTGTLNAVHTYTSPGNYQVKHSALNGCGTSIIKIISVGVTQADIITTPDTTICFGGTKQLRSVPSLNFCWSPTTYLNDPASPNPVTSTPQNITYYLNAEVTGTNLIVNGDFSNGNTGFTSEYNYATPNITEGQYFVGTNPQAWNASLSSCKDHTTAGGNMLLVNGSPTPDVNVWKQTVTVTPNTNYAFSTWIQALWPPNPAQLQFSINGKTIGSLITASLPTCTWTQFYTTWNSGNTTSVVISIVNKNTQVQGNDFALDDISFAPVLIKRDSVIITVDKPIVKTNNDTTICPGPPLQLNTTGANSYSWSPIAGLSNPNIPNPAVTVSNSSTYIVSGTTTSGCVAKDTVVITILPKPVITINNDTTLCKSAPVQLLATGGTSYTWSPFTGLSNPNISNPVASPLVTTNYVVTVSNATTCTSKDSVKITIGSSGSFSVSPDQTVCAKDSKQLIASGGDSYVWQPSTSLDNPNIANPVATPNNTTTYSVTIKDNTCNDSVLLTTTVAVLPLPVIKASKTNDIDCSNNFSQLNATGGKTYSWQPAASLNNPGISNPVANPTSTTLYTVNGTDINGCKNSDTITVAINSNNKSGNFMPNAFTPNNDGINDCFGLKYWGNVTRLDFSIYNRFGERIFYTTDPAKCWDGRYKGVLQNIGTYVYTIKGVTTCGNVDKKGTVVLIR